MKSLQEQLLESSGLLKLLIEDKELDKKVSESIQLIKTHLQKDLPLMICGNGGSASDSMRADRSRAVQGPETKKDIKDMKPHPRRGKFALAA